MKRKGDGEEEAGGEGMEGSATSPRAGMGKDMRDILRCPFHNDLQGARGRA